MSWNEFETHAKYRLYLLLAHLGLDTPVLEALSHANTFLSEDQHQGILLQDIIQLLLLHGFTNNPRDLKAWTRDFTIRVDYNLVNTTLDITSHKPEEGWMHVYKLSWRPNYAFFSHHSAISRDAFLDTITSIITTPPT